MGFKKKYHILIKKKIDNDIKIIADKIDIKIDCEVYGNIISKGEVLIGKKGIYHGNINSRSCIIYGKVIGDIKVDEVIYLKSKAELLGDIECKKIHTDEHAWFNGMCKLTKGEEVINEDQYTDNEIENKIDNKKNIESSNLDQDSVNYQDTIIEGIDIIEKDKDVKKVEDVEKDNNIEEARTVVNDNDIVEDKDIEGDINNKRNKEEICIKDDFINLMKDEGTREKSKESSNDSQKKRVKLF